MKKQIVLLLYYCDGENEYQRGSVLAQPGSIDDLRRIAERPNHIGMMASYILRGIPGTKEHEARVLVGEIRETEDE